MVHAPAYSPCHAHRDIQQTLRPDQADESFIGGKARNMHKDKRAEKITGRGPKDKTIAMGVLERGGEVRVAVVPTRRKVDVQAHVREHVLAGSALFN